MKKIPRAKCLNCSKETSRARYKFCSNKCQRDYEYFCYIKKWKSGKTIGLNCIGLVSSYIKRYLREKFNNKCILCGWSEINIKTGIVPLVADHIDGNWKNNKEGNLRLICPNCDSLTATYAGLNRGNGRKDRVVSKRAQEAKSIVNKPK